MKKRIVSLTMVLALCLMLLPTSAFAAETAVQPLAQVVCVHTTRSMMIPAGMWREAQKVPASTSTVRTAILRLTSCTHEHTRECYPASDSSIPEDGTTSSEDESVLPEAAEPSLCSHVCSEEAAYQAGAGL